LFLCWLMLDAWIARTFLTRDITWCKPHSSKKTAQNDLCLVVRFAGQHIRMIVILFCRISAVVNSTTESELSGLNCLPSWVSDIALQFYVTLTFPDLFILKFICANERNLNVGRFLPKKVYCLSPVKLGNYTHHLCVTFSHSAFSAFMLLVVTIRVYYFLEKHLKVLFIVMKTHSALCGVTTEFLHLNMRVVI